MALKFRPHFHFSKYLSIPYYYISYVHYAQENLHITKNWFWVALI